MFGDASPAGARARELARSAVRLTGRREDSGLGELTLREREVAELAGEGLKTKDIAERLRVSPRTVDVHLTHIYSKLGVNSRAALVRLMALAG
ncbi:helix-turn-helix transcriptional regulator [Streptomyces sp. NPDC051664]|uniref:helix-turn-helix transcriptional regulator n=1 Tax=Streptomyces sp. NPDC051664 TaxID=3365668 RepID=UPI00379478E8